MSPTDVNTISTHAHISKEAALENIYHFSQQAEFQLGCVSAFLDAEAIGNLIPEDMQGHLAAVTGLCRSLDRVLGDIRDTASRNGHPGHRGTGLLAKTYQGVMMAPE